MCNGYQLLSLLLGCCLSKFASHIVHYLPQQYCVNAPAMSKAAAKRPPLKGPSCKAPAQRPQLKGISAAVFGKPGVYQYDIAAGGTLVIACWCQREETPQTPFSDEEKDQLQFLYDEWAHPFFISNLHFGRLMEVGNCVWCQHV